jgi:hypothetical protein
MASCGPRALTGTAVAICLIRLHDQVLAADLAKPVAADSTRQPFAVAAAQDVASAANAVAVKRLPVVGDLACEFRIERGCIHPQQRSHARHPREHSTATCDACFRGRASARSSARISSRSDELRASRRTMSSRALRRRLRKSGPRRTWHHPSSIAKAIEPFLGKPPIVRERERSVGRGYPHRRPRAFGDWQRSLRQRGSVDGAQDQMMSTSHAESRGGRLDAARRPQVLCAELDAPA